MIKEILVVVALVFCLATIVTAEIDYRYYCVNTTQVKEAVINENITGTMQTSIINQSRACDYGCDSKTGKCQPPTYQQTANVGIIVGVIIAIGAVIVALGRR